MYILTRFLFLKDFVHLCIVNQCKFEQVVMAIGELAVIVEQPNTTNKI